MHACVRAKRQRESRLTDWPRTSARDRTRPRDSAELIETRSSSPNLTLALIWTRARSQAALFRFRKRMRCVWTTMRWVDEDKRTRGRG
eukprot:1832525-Rhodomonas_salina.1